MKHFCILFLSLLVIAENITIVGGGYVGIVTGAVLSDVGHKVTILDINKSRIKMLKSGEIPFFEPGLQELVKKNILQGRLDFCVDALSAYQSAQVVFLAVDTPRLPDGNANLKNLLSAVEVAIEYMSEDAILCIKSTVPPGTNLKVQELIKSYGKKIVTASNPEFLREGSAISDFLTVNPIIVGCGSKKRSCLKKIYDPLISMGVPWIEVDDCQTAEFIKYAWNSFGALKVSYVNELASFAEKLNIDIKSVIRAISHSDNLLPLKNITPGPGIGGSCFPKDVDALRSLAKSLGLELPIIDGILESNMFCKKRICESINKLARSLNQKPTVAILGLSFKANTDDVRYSPAIDVIAYCLSQGYNIRAYDPIAIENMRLIYPHVNYKNSMQEILLNADIAVVLTDWPEIKNFDFSSYNNLLILDTRYCLRS